MQPTSQIPSSRQSDLQTEIYHQVAEGITPSSDLYEELAYLEYIKGQDLPDLASNSTLLSYLATDQPHPAKALLIETCDGNPYDILIYLMEITRQFPDRKASCEAVFLNLMDQGDDGWSDAYRLELILTSSPQSDVITSKLLESPLNFSIDPGRRFVDIYRKCFEKSLWKSLEKMQDHADFQAAHLKEDDISTSLLRSYTGTDCQKATFSLLMQNGKLLPSLSLAKTAFNLNNLNLFETICQLSPAFSQAEYLDIKTFFNNSNPMTRQAFLKALEQAQVNDPQR